MQRFDKLFSIYGLPTAIKLKKSLKLAELSAKTHNVSIPANLLKGNCLGLFGALAYYSGELKTTDTAITFPCYGKVTILSETPLELVKAIDLVLQPGKPSKSIKIDKPDKPIESNVSTETNVSYHAPIMDVIPARIVTDKYEILNTSGVLISATTIPDTDFKIVNLQYVLLQSLFLYYWTGDGIYLSAYCKAAELIINRKPGDNTVMPTHEVYGSTNIPPELIYNKLRSKISLGESKFDIKRLKPPNYYGGPSLPEGFDYTASPLFNITGEVMDANMWQKLYLDHQLE